jgi:hypothetical protein
MERSALPLNVTRRIVSAFLAFALAVTAFLTGGHPARAASFSSPIIGDEFNSSARSNCAYAGLSGVAYTGVAFPAALATGTTHLVSESEQGIWVELNYIENSATKVDLLNDCIGGDWYYAFAAAYPSAYVHRTITEQFACNGGGCDLAANYYSGWTAGWAGTVRP